MEKNNSTLGKYNFTEAQLPIDRFQIDKKYQRENVSQQMINKIIRNFNWLSFGKLLINQRDGDYYIIDGVHRYNALLQMSISTAPCLLSQGLIIHEEAAICRDMMAIRRKSTIAEGLKAAITAGDKDMLYLEAKLKSLDIKMGLIQSGNSSSRRTGWITCFGILLRLYKTDQTMFNNVVETLHKLWFIDGYWEPDALRKQIIGGLWFFLKNATKYNSFDLERLISQCGGIGKPKIYWLKAQSNHIYTSKGSVDRLVSLEMLMDYNKGLHARNQLKFEN